MDVWLMVWLSYTVTITIVTIAFVGYQYFRDDGDPVVQHYNIDGGFFEAQDMLCAYNQGDINMTSTSFEAYVYKYVSYLTPTQGRGLLVSLSLAEHLSPDQKEFLKTLLFNHFKTQPFNFLIESISDLLNELDLDFNITVNMQESRLSDFLIMLYQWVVPAPEPINNIVINRWKNLVLTNKSVNVLIKDIIFLLIKNLIKRAFVFALTKVTLVFTIFIIVLFSCQIKVNARQLETPYGQLTFAMLPTPTRVPSVGTAQPPSRRTSVPITAMMRPTDVSSRAVVVLVKGPKVVGILKSTVDPTTQDLIIQKLDFPNMGGEINTNLVMAGIKQKLANPLEVGVAYVDLNSKEMVGVDLMNQAKGANEYLTNWEKTLRYMLEKAFDSKVNPNDFNLIDKNLERAHIMPMSIGLFGKLRSNTEDLSSTLLIDSELHRFIDRLENWDIDSFKAEETNTFTGALMHKINFIVNKILTYDGSFATINLAGDARKLYLATVASRYEHLGLAEIQAIKKNLDGFQDNRILDAFFLNRAVGELSKEASKLEEEIWRFNNYVETFRQMPNRDKALIEKQLANLWLKFSDVRRLENFATRCLGFLSAEVGATTNLAVEGDFAIWRGSIQSANGHVKNGLKQLLQTKDFLSEDSITFYDNYVNIRLPETLAGFEKIYKQEISTTQKRRSRINNKQSNVVIEYVEKLRFEAIAKLRLGNLQRTYRVLEISDGNVPVPRSRARSVPMVSPITTYPQTRNQRSQSEDLGGRAKTFALVDAMVSEIPGGRLMARVLTQAGFNPQAYRTSLNISTTRAPQLAIMYNPE